MMWPRGRHAAPAQLTPLLLLLRLADVFEQARALDQRLIFRDGLQPHGQPGYDGAYEVVRAEERQTTCCIK